MPKVSVYLTSDQKSILLTKSIQYSLSLSQYLLQCGLQNEIKSNIQKAEFASIACQLYTLSDETDDPGQKKKLHQMGDTIYGLLEDQVPSV